MWYIWLALVQPSVDGEDPNGEKNEEEEKGDEDDEDEDSHSKIPVPHQLTHGDCRLETPLVHLYISGCSLAS